MPATSVELRPPQHQVDRRCRPWWACQIGGFFGVPALVLFVLGLFLEPARTWLWWPALLLALVAVGGAVLGPPVLFRIHRWEVTDEAVYSRTGWLWQEWRAAPLSRVQTVDVERGPLQRLFGLATVTVTTASAKGPVRIEALANEQAEQIAHRLTVLTEQDAGRRDAGDAT